MTPEEAFRQLLGLGNSWRVLEAGLKGTSSSGSLRVEEIPELWPEESTRAGSPGGLPRPCCGAAVATPERLKLRVCGGVGPAARTPQQPRQGIQCDSALVGAQQELHPRVRGLCSYPDR